ncbi:MAG: shikimate dehydrogenase [Chloroflexi bacterium]|nr:shikimate dehydrogenase [Chloroflexota bacterium]
MSTSLNGRTKLVGVMGWPVEHSLSPQMHNAAFAALGLNCCYVPLAVPPDHLPQAVAGLAALGFVGSNVTVPHKQAVWACVDELSEDAQAVSAVNTLIRRDGKWVGGNSDIPGFLMSLEEEGFLPRGKRALVLGAGGAARGIVYALARAGAQVTLLNRTVERGEALVREISRLLPGRSLEARALLPEELGKARDDAELLVNTTPLGMWPRVEASPWPDDLPFPAHLTVFDLVYNPLRTRLLSQAQAAGAKAIGGLKMLVYQGAISFRWWFDVMPPTDVMYRACVDEMARR